MQQHSVTAMVELGRAASVFQHLRSPDQTVYWGDDMADHDDAAPDAVRAIVTRADAKALGLKHYYTGLPCANGHVCERNVSDTHCMDCNRARDAARWSERREASNARRKASWFENHEENLAQGKSRWLERRDECNAKRKASWPERREADNARRRALWDEGAAEYRAAKAPEWAAREAARAAGQTTYVSAEPCKHGHVGLRTVERCRCVECLREKSRRSNIQHPYRQVYGPPMPSHSRMLRDEALAAGQSRYFDGVPCPHGHMAERKVSNATCCECHRLKSLERLNKPGVREKIMQATEERSVRMAQATPGWVDWDAVTQMYAEAARLSWQTGVKHHVDHIVPIRGRNVCGLHVQNNMRVIPAFLNRRKSNKLLED